MTYNRMLEWIEKDLHKDDFYKINARIAIGDADGDWQVALLGKNLTDEETTTAVEPEPEIDEERFNIDSNVHDLMAYAAAQAKSPSSRPAGLRGSFGNTMDRQTWVSLSPEGQAQWDTIPNPDKAVILKGTRTRGAELLLKRQSEGKSKVFSPQPPRTPAASVTNTRTLVNSHEQETPPTPPEPEAPQEEPDNQTLLINMAKSDVNPADVRRMLSQTSNKRSPEKEDTFHTPMSTPKSSPKKKVTISQEEDTVRTYKTNFHDILDQPVQSSRHETLIRLLCLFIGFIVALILPYKSPNSHISSNKVQYTVYPTSSRSSRGALVDRGSNGTIAGEDMRIVNKVVDPRRIDVSGINNHQITDLPIGACGGVTKSQKGNVICVFHQAAGYERGRSIISCAQLEYYKCKVSDVSMRCGGYQRIATVDGYCFPLDIINGLPHMKLRPFTDSEWNTLPHVIMTSDELWDPKKMDNTISDKDDWFDAVTDFEDGILDSPFDQYGEYKYLETKSKDPLPEGEFIPAHVDELEVNFHHITSVNDQYYCHDGVVSYETYGGDVSDVKDRPEPEDNEYEEEAKPVIKVSPKIEPKTPDYEELRPYFLGQPKNIVQKTMENTTRWGRTEASNSQHLTKTHKSPFPAFNVRRRNEAVATDLVYSDTPAVDSGAKHAQIFVGRDTLVIDFIGMKSDSEFIGALQDVIRKRGAMDKLISDSARAELSLQVLDALRALMIENWQSEPYFQWQNFAERRWKEVLRLINWIMNTKGCPADTWLLAGQFVRDVLNLSYNESIKGVPLQKLTGQTQDTSILLLYQFWDPVYIQRYTEPGVKGFPSKPDEIKGRFVGFSHDVGHHFTFKVLTDDTRKIIHRSVLRKADTGRNLRIDVDPDDPNMKQFVHSKRPTTDGEQRLPTAGKLDPEECIGRSVLMPVQKDGTRPRATVMERVDEHKKNLATNPDYIRYRVKVGNNEDWEEVVAYNELMDVVQSNKLDDGAWTFKSVIGHSGPLTKNDPGYNGSSYNVLIRWETGEQTHEPLSDFANSSNDAKLCCAVHARKNNLLEKPGWKQFKKLAKREKKLIRLVNQAKLTSFRLTPVHMHGYLVPRNYQQALELDKQNGNTKWADATQLELHQVLGYGTFNDHGRHARGPEGHKRINVHFVYAVKHDGRHKARLVAGGHLTDTPIDSVYSSVVSLKGVRVISFLAELNGLDLWSTDIGNAYLESPTSEKVYIVAGPEFKDVGLEGHTLVIVKALYGLKSSGLRWWEILADVLSQMGFFPSKAERDIWMRDKGDHYEYVFVYVDDLGIASKDSKSIVDELENRYGFKLKGTGPIQFHLGCDYFRDKDGVLCFAPKKYIEKMIDTYKRLFGNKPKDYVSPLVKGDHPELDTSPELELEGIKKYQSMVGAMQWAVQLGRLDITAAVMTMSGFRAAPRVGHLDRVKRIYGYLANFRGAVIRARTEEPEFSDLPDKTYDWENSVYKGAEEQIPTDAPKPLGKRVVTSDYVDANLYHDYVSGKSVTGILTFFNKTPVDWYSKKQATVETATYGSEHVAARTATEKIMENRMYLRYLGVPVHDSRLFGDNESVVNSSSLPDARLHKRHVALSFHRVREAIAARIMRFFWIEGPQNPADILSKHWGYQQVWPLLKPILFWEGDAADLITEDE